MDVKLTDIYGTRYFYISMSQDLMYLFSCLDTIKKDPSANPFAGGDLLKQVFEAAKRGEEIRFDCAGAKFTPDTTDIIADKQRKGYIFIDTQDEWRNNVFEENRRRLSLNIKDKSISLPEYNVESQLVPYLKNLQGDVVYTIPFSNNDVYIPLVTLILLRRPSITINLGDFAPAIFNHIGTMLTVFDLQKYHEFYYATRYGVEIVSFDSGTIYIQTMQKHGDMIEALSSGYLVPTVVGKEVLYNVSPFREIFDRDIRYFNNYKQSRKITLKDFLIEENLYVS